jgi:hypothetical protein
MLIYILIGSDMRELKSSVTRSLCDQILTSPIHWTGSGVQEMPSFSIHSILNMKHVGRTGGPLTWFKPGDLSSHSFPLDFVV